MYECFHCGCRAVIWDCDYDAEDIGYADPGIVQMCHCSNCGAEITYYIPLNKDADDSEEGQTDGKTE